jgi:replication factor A1
MKISELKAGDPNVEVKGKIIEVGESRNVNTRFGASTVADAIIKDETGQIKLTLWRDQISKVKSGDEVEIIGGYVKEWNGELQLGIGKNGELKVL